MTGPYIVDQTKVPSFLSLTLSFLSLVIMVGILRRQPADGVVLKMKLSGNPTYGAIYSVEAIVGQNNQKVSLSVDTGSSDLWIASRDCSSSPCSSSKAALYDSSTSSPAGQTGHLKYLSGAASGPIVWENFTLGPYTIPAQAMVAADTVSNEQLSPDFLGLLGLSLPPSSEIASLIPPTESDAADGATVQSNLFGLTPVEAAPGRHFIGITLERPNAMHVPSFLAIGKHPTEEIPNLDTTKLGILPLVSSEAGDKYWRVSLTSITGWVDGRPKPVSIGPSISLPSNPNPAAILDTGGPIILATRELANAIYGAFDVSPAADGNYYLPCTTPMNLTIGLGDLPPIPVHPLDLTSLPQTITAGTNTQTCMGIIQASDQLNGLADIVLGVAFMRNVYTVLLTEDSDPLQDVEFRLGLLALTDAHEAMDEFHSIRVLGENPNSQASKSSSTDHRKVSVGIIVLIAIVAFFALCATIFGVRFWFMRKKYGKGEAENYGDVKKRDEMELNDGPFLKNWEGDKPRGHALTDSTYGSEYTRVDEHGVIGKPDTSSTLKSSRNSIPSQIDGDRISHIDQQPSPGHSRTASANSRENVNESDSIGMNDRNSRHLQQPSAVASRTAEGDLGMTSITSRETTVRPVPRPQFGRHAPSPSGRFNGFDMDPLFDIDFASGTVGRYPTNFGPQTERRSSSFGLNGDSSISSQHSPRPSTGNGDRIRTFSESGRMYGHSRQPSMPDFVDSPLLPNRERY